MSRNFNAWAKLLLSAIRDESAIIWYFQMTLTVYNMGFKGLKRSTSISRQGIYVISIMTQWGKHKAGILGALKYNWDKLEHNIESLPCRGQRCFGTPPSDPPASQPPTGRLPPGRQLTDHKAPTASTLTTSCAGWLSLCSISGLTYQVVHW